MIASTPHQEADAGFANGADIMIGKVPVCL